MEAKVMMMKCQKNRRAFGGRIQKDGPNWILTWAFEIDERIAEKEGFQSESTISGSFKFDDEYPGCPHCGANSFFTCGKCGKVTCWDGSPTVTCGWCGHVSKIELVDKLQVKGGGF
ncbi:TerY-C metal binding domain-containing protein [Intestinibacter sp.]